MSLFQRCAYIVAEALDKIFLVAKFFCAIHATNTYLFSTALVNLYLHLIINFKSQENGITMSHYIPSLTLMIRSLPSNKTNNFFSIPFILWFHHKKNYLKQSSTCRSKVLACSLTSTLKVKWSYLTKSQPHMAKWVPMM